MTDETNIPIRASKDFKIPEITPEAREVCAGDYSRGDIKIPDSVLQGQPAGMSKTKWVNMVGKGEEFRKATPGDAKKKLAFEIMEPGSESSLTDKSGRGR